MTAVSCRGITRAGKRCRARPIIGTDWCIAHTPAISEEEKRAWAARGGKNSSNEARAKKELPMEPLTAEELAAYLSLAFKAVLYGQKEPSILNAMSNAARAMSELRRDADVQTRLQELEELLGIRRLAS